MKLGPYCGFQDIGFAWRSACARSPVTLNAGDDRQPSRLRAILLNAAGLLINPQEEIMCLRYFKSNLSLDCRQAANATTQNATAQ
jgi:hypothetical protein